MCRGVVGWIGRSRFFTPADVSERLILLLAAKTNQPSIIIYFVMIIVLFRHLAEERRKKINSELRFISDTFGSAISNKSRRVAWSRYKCSANKCCTSVGNCVSCHRKARSRSVIINGSNLGRQIAMLNVNIYLTFFFSFHSPFLAFFFK